MPDINQSGKVNQKIQKDFRLTAADGNGSHPIEDLIRPVMQINDPIFYGENIVQSGSASGTTTTLYTIPSQGDFYLKGFDISTVIWATLASSEAYLNVTVNGVAKRLGQIMVFTDALVTETSNNAEMNQMGMMLRLDNGSVVSLTEIGGVNAAKATIYGFQDLRY